MDIKITQEKRGEVERIQDEFRKKLSQNEILRGTAQGINAALSRSVPRINKRIKEKYNITQKYLSRQAAVSPKANSNNLYGGIKVNEQKLPMIAFRAKQSGSSISVSIHKGKTVYLRNSFITTVRGKGGGGNHQGVFSRGEYMGRFVAYNKSMPRGVRYTADSGYTKQRITQIMGPSVFTMAIRNEVANDVGEFMGNEVSARVHGILTSRVNKIAAQN